MHLVSVAYRHGFVAAGASFVLLLEAIIRDLRKGEFDVLVGINLLREGLDIPEVSLVAILDADKEGFLRSHVSLIQTIGRAARNLHGRVIMYVDQITDSMKQALDETDRRREVQRTLQRGARHHPALGEEAHILDLPSTLYDAGPVARCPWPPRRGRRARPRRRSSGSSREYTKDMQRRRGRDGVREGGRVPRPRAAAQGHGPGAQAASRSLLAAPARSRAEAAEDAPSGKGAAGRSPRKGRPEAARPPWTPGSRRSWTRCPPSPAST